MANNHKIMAQDWFEKAEADFDLAKVGFRETEHWGQICFLCHQTVEKYLKGFLVAKEKKFPKIHNIVSLLKRCQKVEDKFEQFIFEAKILERYYIPTRYPVPARIIFNKKDAEEALQIAEKFVDFIQNLL